MKRAHLTLNEKQRLNDLIGEKVHALPCSQADRVIEKFGGVPRLLELLGKVGLKRNRSSVHRWRYSVEDGGTGGIIPSHDWRFVIKAAQIDGIILTSQDLDPRIMVDE